MGGAKPLLPLYACMAWTGKLYQVAEDSIKLSNGLTIQGNAGGVRTCFKLPDP